jgi:hypothetical protein
LSSPLARSEVLFFRKIDVLLLVFNRDEYVLFLHEFEHQISKLAMQRIILILQVEQTI